jgi:membrane protease subunit HflK
VEPGLHLKFPFGVERVYPVPTQRKLKEEFGFRTVEAGVRTQFATRGYEEETLMLTGDLNIASVEWIVQYQIKDPVKYLFRVRNVRDTLRAASEAVMREVIGDRSVNEVLTTGRIEVGVAATTALQTVMNQYETGVDILLVQPQTITPPDPVKPSFNEVNQAEQESKRLINEAESEYQEAIPRARGEAQQLIQTAEGYAAERVNRAKGDGKRFVAIYQEYIKAKDVTRRRLYLETMREILPKVGRKIVIDEKAKNVLPLLELSGKGVRK